MIAHSFWRRGTIVAVVVAGLLGLASCLPVPLGDPAKSKVDSRFFGVWEWRDSRVHRAIMRPWDERTLIVDILSGDLAEDGATKPRERDLYKAWLTDIKGQTFMTLQPIETVGMVNGDARQAYFIVAKVKIEGMSLTAMALDPEFKKLKDAANREALERIVSDSLDDPKLFTTTPIVAARWSVDQMKGLEKLQDAFREWK
jgi:hypothetical protein